MAASDPTTDVPTPTGTLQGVAAFSWDGSAWQPAGRAGPSVATPTGVLRGVAAFNGGPAWQPSGRAQPGVATSSGVLDGVAVYTWSGSAWTPAGGGPTPSTPSGSLRGVAAFNWDGSAWQPAGQAGPSVATPYGVLDGVAMFQWSGSAWAAVGAPSLSLDFMQPGALDPRITFTRASTATYFDTTGTMQTAATNAPRWDYNPSTLALNGLLIEEARTNLILQSADLSNAAWSKGGAVVAAPVVTGNQAIAPDGTLTASRVVFPTVTGANAISNVTQSPTMNGSAYTFTIWMRGNVGGEQTYLASTPDGVNYNRIRVTLTTSWQRFVLAVPATTVAPWYFAIGTDLRDASETTTPAGTIFAWGGQVELGAFPTSYIPTLGATVTRSADRCVIPPANMGWFTSPGGSWFAEFLSIDPTTGGNRRVIGQPTAGMVTPLFRNPTLNLGQFDGVAAANTANAMTANVVTKAASTWAPGAAKLCLNAGAVATAATLTTGYGTMTTNGVAFMQTNVGVDGTENMSGYIRRIRYWPRVLADTELQSVTT